MMELCGADLCGGLVQRKSTPLHHAAKHGHSESVQLLLAAKGNVNAKGYVSASPFANMMELYGAELSVGSCRGREHRCTTLLSMVTVSQCSTCSLPRPISMLRTMCVPLSLSNILNESCGSELCVGLMQSKETALDLAQQVGPSRHAQEKAKCVKLLKTAELGTHGCGCRIA